MFMWDSCQRVRTFWYCCSILKDSRKKKHSKPFYSFWKHAAPDGPALEFSSPVGPWQSTDCFFNLHKDPKLYKPVCKVNCFFVWRGNSKTHRWDHSLVPSRTDDLPLGAMRIVCQNTFIVFVNGYLVSNERDKNWGHQSLIFCTQSWELLFLGGREKPYN